MTPPRSGVAEFIPLGTMLEQLRIRNLTVIEDLSIRFEPGLNLLTGATGAGKSIIVGSLSLLLGHRADPEQVRSGAGTAVVEATFQPGNGRGSGGDGSGSDDPATGGGRIRVRREIRAGGRSAAFWNDAPIPIGRLRSGLEDLVALHGQHVQQGLLRASTYGDILDQFGGHHRERQAVRRHFLRLRELERKIHQLEGDPDRLRARREMLEFQVEEIGNARPSPGEDEELRRERDLLRNAERFLRAGQSITASLEADDGVTAAVNRLEADLRELAAVDARFGDHAEQVRGFAYLLQELGAEVTALQERVDCRPGRLAAVEARLSMLQALKNRFGGSLEAVIAHRDAAEGELDSLRDVGAATARLERERESVRGAYFEAAADLSGKRRAAARRMEKSMTAELQALAFPRGTGFGVEILPTPAADSPFEPDGVPVAYGASGWDTVDFRLAANPGEPPRTLARIASGGELSRILLAIQSLGAGRRRGRTFIFDEVDTGVGAEVAAAVGERLRRLAAHQQVICVTHWAQVAAGADCHFRVEKAIRSGRTRVAVRRLRGEDRRREIARMLGGRVTPDSSLRHARDLLAALSPGQGAG